MMRRADSFDNCSPRRSVLGDPWCVDDGDVAASEVAGQHVDPSSSGGAPGASPACLLGLEVQQGSRGVVRG